MLDEEGDKDETDDDRLSLEAAIAQCLYLRYGVDMEHRNTTWGVPLVSDFS